MGYDSFYDGASTVVQAYLKKYFEQNCLGLADNGCECMIV